MSDKDISIVPYSVERAGECVDLLNVALGRTHEVVRDVALWQWKHELNPFGRSLILLAETDGKLVGIRAFMRWQLSLRGVIIQAAKPVDTVTHPDYQRRGIFSRLTQAASEQAASAGIAVLLNTPNTQSREGYLKLGWQEIANLRVLVKLAPTRLCRAILNRHVPDLPARSNTVPQLLSDAAVVHRLLDMPARDSMIRTHVTPDLLRWRYTCHPHLHYEAVSIGSYGTVEACVFYRVKLRGQFREAMITQVLPRQADPHMLNDLFVKLEQCARADYYVATDEGAPVSDSLRRRWYFRHPNRSISLVGRCLDSADRSFSPIAHPWSLTFQDIEGL